MLKDFWRERNVLVTGATGLLGPWLIEALLERGANIVAVVRDWVPRSRFFELAAKDRVTLVRGDVEDYAVLERTLNEYEIESVFHLAAQAIVGTANRSPLSTFETNIRGTWNLLEAARRLPTVKRIVIASSDKAYGDQEKLPYNESCPLQGTHPYDVSKSCADLIARAYFVTYELPVCVTRSGNFYGGGDLNFNRIVPGTIRSALLGRRPIIRSDGTYIRDYVYVKDVAQAYLFLAEKMDSQKIHGEAFNFSNEKRLTVLELVKLILSLMGRNDLRPDVRNEAVGEIKHQYLSARKARKTLGWKPQYTLEQGLLETIEWYRNFLK